jgi:prevent-host-death family protein
MNRIPSKSPTRAKAQKPSPPGRTPTWKLEDAKAKFSEVVRRAQDHGPQYISVRGKPTVAIVDIAELERWMPAPPDKIPLVDFLESLDLKGLDLDRGRDFGRDPEL